MRSFKGLYALALLVLALFCFPAHASALPVIPPASGIEHRHRDAIELLRKNEFGKVAELEERAIAEDGRDLVAYMLLSIAHLGSGDEKKAVETAEKARAVEEKFASAVYGSMGRFFLVKKRYHKALVYLKESLKVVDDPDITRDVASIYLNQGLLKEAREYYEKVVDTRPDYINLGRIYLAESDFENAIDCALKALREDVKAPAGYLVLGTGYILTDKTGLARSNFRILRELSPEFFLTGYFLGLIELIEKKYDDSLAHFVSFSVQAPELKEGYLNTALVLLLKGDAQKAKEIAEGAVLKDPLDPSAHFALGCIYMALGESARADLEFQKSPEVFPEFGNPGFQASKYFKKGTEDPAGLLLLNTYGAAGLYVQSAREKAGNPFSRIFKARALLKNGEKRSAALLYEAILAEYPELITPRMELGDIEDEKGDSLAAIGHYRKASTLLPASSRVNLKLGELYAKTGKLDEAEAQYKKAIENSPQSTSGYIRLATLLAESGKMDEAGKYASMGNSVNPEDIEMRDTLGWVYFKSGKLHDAGKVYGSLAKATVNNPAIYYHMGVVNQKLNQTGVAAEAFEKALNIKDEFPGSVEAKTMLKKLSGLS